MSGCTAPAEDEVEEASLNQRYQEELKGLTFGTFDRTAKGAYMYECAKKASQIIGNSRRRQKRIAKELRSMQSEGGLPFHSSASIFIRHDEDRIDVVRRCVPGSP
jgi:hypothetical protein